MQGVDTPGTETINNNKLIRDFSKEQHELPEDDKQCAV
jgi:hypothetical protein